MLMSCGTITFYTNQIVDDAGAPVMNSIKYTGYQSAELFTGSFPSPTYTAPVIVNQRFFSRITEFPFASDVLFQANGLVRPSPFDFLQLYLVNKRLLINRVSVSFYSDNNVSQGFEYDFRIKIYHSGVTGFTLDVVVPAKKDTSGSGAYYNVYESNKEFWIQKSFNMELQLMQPTPLVGSSIAVVQLHIEKIDTYANPFSLYETECNKVGFDGNLPSSIHVNN